MRTKKVIWVLALLGLSYLAGCVVEPARPVYYYDGPVVVYDRPCYYGGYYHHGYYR